MATSHNWASGRGFGAAPSASGALGAATNGVVGEMVPLIAAAPVPRRVREQWLERLFEAIQDDDPPYIESLGKYWGVLCGDPELASHWADRLLPLVKLVKLVMAERGSGVFAYTNAGTPCYSALFHAGRLDDLIASTPGEEGKWFATAKTLKEYDLALALARRSPVDPKTLVRAARDHVETRPAFAFEAALLALYWIASGVGYELTCLDVLAARDHALAAARALGRDDSANALVAERVAGTTASAQWARECLGIERS